MYRFLLIFVDTCLPFTTCLFQFPAKYREEAMLTIILDALYILQGLHILIADSKIKSRIVSHVIWVCRLRNDYKTKLNIITEAKLSNRYSILISYYLNLFIIENCTVCNLSMVKLTQFVDYSTKQLKLLIIFSISASLKEFRNMPALSENAVFSNEIFINQVGKVEQIIKY
jgi:hypothetical protein